MSIKEHSPGPKTEILIVEDSRTQAEQLRYLLEQHHFKITVATNGKQALSLLSEYKPALVISDIIMPEMNGYELCKSIKTDFGDEGIPVILLTSLEDVEDVLEGLACGADSFITKPYSEDYILAVINQILANLDIYKGERKRIDVEIVFAGKNRFISAEQQQILTLLLSLYEAAVHKNKELTQTQEKLRLLNENLEGLVEQRTAMLTKEIKERKRAQDALLLKNFVFDASIAANSIADLNGVITEANEAFLRVWGYPSKDEVVGKPLAHFINDPNEGVAIVTALNSTGQWEGDYIAKRKDGSTFNAHGLATTVKDENGKVIGYQSAVLDVTEQRDAEKELKKHHDHLEQLVAERTALLEAANKELEAFSYSVSHDLRAPLRAIEGFSRIVLEEYAKKLDNEGRRLLDVIAANTHKMGQLIDDLLAFSRLSRQQIAFAPVDLALLAEAIFSELKSLEKERHIEFRVGALPAASGDHSMLQQVLQNLLANAVKFTRPRKLARLEFGGRTEKTENVYFVKDNGGGFDMEYVDKIFGVFQRLHGAKEFEGTGVGLAIVQRIISRHGGRVWAESKGGKGATFYFAIPNDKGLGSRG